jgi:hypothetical protein
LLFVEIAARADPIPRQQAEYHSLGEIFRAGAAAADKRATARICLQTRHRRTVDAAEIGSSMTCSLWVPDELRPDANGIPRCDSLTPGVRVRLRVDVIGPDRCLGTLLSVLDVLAPWLPPEVDFDNIDDIHDAGAEAVGKVAQLPVQKIRVYENQTIVVRECRRSRELTVMYIAAQSELVRGISSTRCVPIQVLLARLNNKWGTQTWEADLVGVPPAPASTQHR